jgi:hypothetical protein
LPDKCTARIEARSGKSSGASSGARRAMSFSVATIALLAAQGLSHSGLRVTAPDATTQPLCRVSRWSKPTSIEWSDGITWHSSVAQSEHGTYVFGDDQPWFRPVASDRELITLDIANRSSITQPGAGKRFLFPLAIGMRDGVQLVWGEGGVARGGSDAYVTEIWWARYRVGSGWADARRVYSAPTIYWVKATIGRTASGDDERAFFTAPIWDDRGSGVLLVRSQSDSAVSSVIRVRGGVAYTSISQQSSGKVLIAFVGSDPTARHDRNSLFVLRSNDNAKSWSQPILVSRSGLSAATEVHVLTDSSNAWHLVWHQSRSNGQLPDVLRHEISRDDGRTWSAPQDLPLPSEVTLIRAAIDRCGALQLVGEYHPNGSTVGARLLYTRLTRDSTWSALTTLYPTTTLTDPDLSAGPDGAITLTALMWSPSDLGPSGVRTIVATLGGAP